MQKKRIGWIDSVRFLAIFWVMTTHYISVYHGHWLGYWNEGISSYFLQGLTGKFAVAIFCLLTGYFTAVKMSREYSLPGYIRDRYLQFSQGVLFMNAALAVGIRTLYHFGIINLGFRPDVHNVKGILHDSFLFSSEIILPFWCIQVFFVSGVLLAFVYKIKKCFGIRCILALLCMAGGYVWVGLCILGSVLYDVQQFEGTGKFLEKRWLQLLLLAGSFVIIQRPEGNLTFILYGAAGFCILLVLFYNPRLQGWLDRKPLRFLGVISFEFYLVHIPVQTIISFYIYLFLMNRINIDVAFIISYAATLMIDIGAAYLYHKFLANYIKFFRKVTQVLIK